MHSLILVMKITVNVPTGFLDVQMLVRGWGSVGVEAEDATLITAGIKAMPELLYRDLGCLPLCGVVSSKKECH